MYNDDRHTRIDAARTAVAQQSLLRSMSMPAPVGVAATMAMPSSRKVLPTDAVHLTFTSIRLQDKTRVTSLDTIYKHPQQEHAFRHRTTMTVPTTDTKTEPSSPVHVLQDANSQSEESDSNGVGLGIEVANAAQLEKRSFSLGLAREVNGKGGKDELAGELYPDQLHPEEDMHRRQYHHHGQQDRGQQDYKLASSYRQRPNQSQHSGWGSNPVSPKSAASSVRQSNQRRVASPSSYPQHFHAQQRQSPSPSYHHGHHSHQDVSHRDYERYTPYTLPPSHHRQNAASPLAHSSSMPLQDDHMYGVERDIILLKRWQASSNDSDIEADHPTNNGSGMGSLHSSPHYQARPSRLARHPLPLLRHHSTGHPPRPSSSHRERASGAAAVYEEYPPQDPYYSAQYHHRDRGHYEPMDWERLHHYDQVRDRAVWTARKPGLARQSQVRDRVKESPSEEAAALYLPSSVPSGSGAPRPQELLSPAHVEQHRSHHQSAPPLLPHMQPTPVREDTIPSGGLNSTAPRSQPDHAIKEEEDLWMSGQQDHYLQLTASALSPRTHTSSRTPRQQPSPSPSAHTPPTLSHGPAAVRGGTTTMDSYDQTMSTGPGSSSMGVSAYLSTSRKPRPYPCAYPGCGRIFEKRCNMLSHHWTHFPAEMPRHPCPTCGKSFTRMHDVQRHISTVHEGSRNFVCAGCRRAFARRNGLNRHQQQSELCKGTGLLTPAEAAVIGGQPPAAARGARGRKLSMPVPSDNNDAEADPGNVNSRVGAAVDSSRSIPVSLPPESMSLGTTRNIGMFPLKTKGSAEEGLNSIVGDCHQPREQQQQHGGGSVEGDELDDEENPYDDDSYAEEEIDQLQDDLDDESEDEVDQLSDEEHNQTTEPTS